MKRIILVLTVGAMMAAMMVFAAPAMADRDFDCDDYYSDAYCDYRDDYFDALEDYYEDHPYRYAPYLYAPYPYWR